MEQSFSTPPNWDKIEKAFPTSVGRAVYAYNKTIYNPFKVKLTPDLCEHEEVHSKRQGGDPESWWDRYIADSEFRLEEEIIAYAGQLAYIKKMFTSKTQKMVLEAMAKALSGEMYGNLISYPKAETRIRHLARELV